MFNFQQNHFQLFGLPERYALDAAQLDERYRKLQAEVHPDRFAAATEGEKLRSIQAATQVNEAYQTLKSPVARARYLLQLRGVDTQEDTNTAMPAAFLMQQMTWREAIEDASHAADVPTLERLLRELRHENLALQQALGTQLDQQQDNAQAAASVRKLRFLDKVRDEIEQAIEALET